MGSPRTAKKPDTTVECKPIQTAPQATSLNPVQSLSHGTSQQDCLSIPRCAIKGNFESSTFTVNEHQYYASIRGREQTLGGCDDLMQKLHDEYEAKYTLLPCEPDEVFIQDKLCGTEGTGSPEVAVLAKNFHLTFGACKLMSAASYEQGLELKNSVDNFCKSQSGPTNPFLTGIALSMGSLMFFFAIYMAYKLLCRRSPAPAPVIAQDEEAGQYHELVHGANGLFAGVVVQPAAAADIIAPPPQP